MKARFALAICVLFAASLLAGCDRTDEPEAVGGEKSGEEPTPTTVAVVAKDFSFDAPASIAGGLVEFSFTNQGNEPHFAGFARVAPGKSFGDVEAAMTAPPPAEGPAGPPPFEDFAGIPTADPGTGGRITLNVPAGTYAFFCLIPSPDGVSHAAKGMVKELRVGEAIAGRLPEPDITMVATDFEFDQTPSAEDGSNTVLLRNEGRQLHEVNLVELGSDGSVDDVIAWYGQPAGPPPMRSLAGVAIRPGEEATATMDLKAGSTYAFVCVIPDVLGDFAPHITKGMFTQTIRVT